MGMAERTNGKGSIYQLDKGKDGKKPRSKCRKWRLVISLGKDPQTGKYPQKSKVFHGTFKEAQKALREFDDEITHGRIVKKSSWTFNEYMEVYLKDREDSGELTQKTLRSTRNSLRGLAYLIGHVRLQDVTAAALKKAYNDLRNGNSRSGRKLRGTTVHEYHVASQTMFEHARKAGIIAVALFAYDWRMALACLWGVPVAFALLFGSRKLAKRNSEITKAAAIQVSDGIQETLEGIREIRATNQEERFLQALNDKIDYHESTMIRGELSTGIFVNAASVIMRLGVATTILVGTGLILSGQTPSINVAILGLTVGELVSMGVCIAAILPVYYARESSKSETAARSLPAHDRSACAPAGLRTGLLSSVFCMALPLTLNRIVLNLLQSVESVSIPARLRLYGYDNATALSIYGVLTGMALPMIFFPNALTNSVSVLLLPMISEDYARGDLTAVKRTIARTLKFCGIMGLGCLSGFFLLGDFMGVSLFDSALAGHFIKTLSFLCPFLYLDATLSSILQGLGKTGTIFFMNMIALLLRLSFVFFAIPRFGITGYLWGMLASQIALSLLYLLSLRLFLKKLRYNGKSK